jgi:guanidinopropionase
MGDKKLEALRAKFGGAAAGDVQDPNFKKVIDLLFRGADRRAKPYEGISTFLDAPMRPDAAATGDFSGIDIPLIGVPMDLGVTHRPGSRLGPRAVRQVERIGPYHHVHRIVPMAECGVFDIGDVPFRSRYSLEQSHEDIEAFYTPLAKAGMRPVSIGGDHSITLPILKALSHHPRLKGKPPGMIHIDAHCDTSGPYEGTRFHHGGPFREAVLAGVLDPARVIQIGIRGNAEYLWEFSYESGMTVIHAEEFHAMGLDATIAKMRAVVGEGPVYCSFDIDSLDPAFAPGTGTPEIGGLSSREAMALLRGAAGLDVIGGDVVEVAPQYDATTNTAHAGAQMLFEIVSLVAMATMAGRGVRRPF